MKRTKLLGFLALAFIVLSACGNNEVEPVSIDEATDTCAICNMQVMNSQFATEVILTNDKVQKFDDIGCMYEWLGNNGSDDVAAQFVRDYHTKDWIQGDQATYVYNQHVKTPMSYNVISFASSDDAEQFIAENEGELLTYDDLQTHKWPMSKTMNMDGHSHGEDHDESMDMNEEHDSDSSSEHNAH